MVQFNIKRNRNWNLCLGNESEQTDNQKVFSDKTKTKFFQNLKIDFFSPSLLIFPQTDIAMLVFNTIWFPKQICCSQSGARRSEVSTVFYSSM